MAAEVSVITIVATDTPQKLSDTSKIRKNVRIQSLSGNAQAAVGPASDINRGAGTEKGLQLYSGSDLDFGLVDLADMYIVGEINEKFMLYAEKKQ